MKRMVTVGIVVCGLLTAVEGFGFNLPILGKKQAAPGPRVDINGLASREGALRMRLHKATCSLASGLVEIQKACGRAAEASKLEATLTEAKKNPDDVEGSKKLVAEVNTASDELNKIDLNASMNKTEARKRLGKSLLHLGAGMFLDVQATSDGKGLLTDISEGIKAVQSAPLSYGFGAVKTLTRSLGTAKFVAETIPSQITSVTGLTHGLIKYAQTNQIEVPSSKEQEEMAKQMEKE